jgi:hypothetical protein
MLPCIVNKGDTFSSSYKCLDDEKWLVRVIQKTLVKDANHAWEMVVDLSSWELADILEAAAKELVIRRFRPQAKKLYASDGERASKNIMHDYHGSTIDLRNEFPKQSGGGTQTAESKGKSGLAQIAKESETKKQAIARVMAMMPGLDVASATAVVEANMPELK